MDYIELLAPKLQSIDLSEAAIRDMKELDPSEPMYHDALEYIGRDVLGAYDPFRDATPQERKKLVKHYVHQLDGT